MGFLAILAGLAPVFSEVIAKIPDPNERAKAEASLAQAQLQIMASQAEITKVEAANPNVWVSGWRPAVGWVCALSCLYQFIIFHILTWASMMHGWTVPPVIDSETMMYVLGSLLGVGAMRSYDKAKGTSR